MTCTLTYNILILRLFVFLFHQLKDFLPVMKLYDLLYSDTEVIPMADVNKAQSTHRVASTCIWIHLNKKAQTDKVKLPRPIPYALQEHQK